ncbi:unnamed protein product, partial [Chrysoparadoxa australica]
MFGFGSAPPSKPKPSSDAVEASVATSTSGQRENTLDLLQSWKAYDSFKGDTSCSPTGDADAWDYYHSAALYEAAAEYLAKVLAWGGDGPAGALADVKESPPAQKPSSLEAVKEKVGKVAAQLGLDTRRLGLYVARLLMSGGRVGLDTQALMLQACQLPEAVHVLLCTAVRSLLRCCHVHFQSDLEALSMRQVEHWWINQGLVYGHLNNLQDMAMQLEDCLCLHSQGCLSLSSRAQMECAVGMRIGLLLEAWGKRYDVIEALIQNPLDMPSLLPEQLDGLEEEEAEVEALAETAVDELKHSHHSMATIAEHRQLLGTAYCYFQDMSRPAAEEFLSDQPPGSFLLRPAMLTSSGNPEHASRCFCLSVKTYRES